MYQYETGTCDVNHCVMTPLADYAKLVSAVEADDKEAVRQLLDKGTDVNANMDNDIGRQTVCSSLFIASDFKVVKNYHLV